MAMWLVPPTRWIDSLPVWHGVAPGTVLTPRTLVEGKKLRNGRPFVHLVWTVVGVDGYPRQDGSWVPEDQLPHVLAFYAGNNIPVK